MKNQNKLIIFDLDGTLYQLDSGSFQKSSLRRQILKNAETYIAMKLSKNQPDARCILNDIQKQYGEQISIGLEKDFGINRYDYFNTVWNISARRIVKKAPYLKKTLLTLKKTYMLALVSDAPLVWINNVLEELGIQNLFRDNIFSGEGSYRKGLNNAFPNIVQILKIKPSNCVVIGDQEHTDIIPAKELGMRAILINNTKKSRIADATIKSIRELPATLKNKKCPRPPPRSSPLAITTSTFFFSKISRPLPYVTPTVSPWADLAPRQAAVDRES